MEQGLTPDIDSKLGIEKSPYWCAITRINNTRSLFQIPVVESGAEWMCDLRLFVLHASMYFHRALRNSQAKLIECEHSGEASALRNQFAEHLTHITRLSKGEKPLEACVAIIDFTRTSLPQLSGKAARDAFAMGYLLGFWESEVARVPRSCSYRPILGFSGHELAYDGKTWSKPSDVGELYYERIRKDHPLVIFWRTEGHCIIHPDYE